MGFLPNNSGPKLLRSLLPFWDQNETWLLQGTLILLSCPAIIFSKTTTNLFVPTLLFATSLFMRGFLLEIGDGGPGQPRLLIFCLNTLWIIVQQNVITATVLGGVAALFKLSEELKASSLSSSLLFYTGAGSGWLTLKANLVLWAVLDHASYCFSFFSFMEEAFTGPAILKCCALNRTGLLQLTLYYTVAMVLGISLSSISRQAGFALILMRNLIIMPRHALVVLNAWSRGMTEKHHFRIITVLPPQSLFLMNIILAFLPITISYVVCNIRILSCWKGYLNSQLATWA